MSISKTINHVYKSLDLAKLSTNLTTVVLRDLMSNMNDDRMILNHFLPLSNNIMVCDGGINRLLYNEKSIKEGSVIFHCGDFDSSPHILTEKEVMKWNCKYKLKIMDQDQDHNDLEKGLNYFIDPKHKEIFNPIEDIIIQGVVGSRFDHSINNISILTRLCEQNPELNFYATTNDYQLIFLPPGTHTVKPAAIHQKHQGVGIISMAPPHSTLKTKGMRWNIDSDTEFGMGKFQSSSNEIIASEIEIESDYTTILSLQYHKYFKLDPDMMV